jgi:large subunit ribosomal protein L25
MAQPVTIKAERRTTKGKSAARALRRDGKVPAVIYGHGRNSASLAVNATELDKALQGIAAESTVIELKVDGAPSQVLIREIQRHPVRLNITHVDFYEIHAGETLTLGVPVKLVGTPKGVKDQGGVLEQFLREIEIEVLPQHIPDHLELDVSALEIGDSLHVRDLAVTNAEILEELDATVCTVVPPRVEEEPVPAEPAEMVEPELIRRPKEEEEGVEGEGGEEREEKEE